MPRARTGRPRILLVVALTVLAAASPASAPRASATAVLPSFEASGDLWAYATGALTSTDSALVFEAHAAARECMGLLSTITELQSFAGGGVGSITGPLSPERQIAIERPDTRAFAQPRGEAVRTDPADASSG